VVSSHTVHPDFFHTLLVNTGPTYCTESGFSDRLFTYGPKIEQACEWYQKFEQQYPQFNTQLQYHEFSQSVMPHVDFDFGNRDVKQCKMNYVALGEGSDYTLMPGGDRVAHVPGTTYLMNAEREHSAVVSGKTVFLTVVFHHSFEEVATQLEVI